MQGHSVFLILVFEDELWVENVKTTTLVQRDSCTFWPKVVDEERLRNESDRHVVASKLDCTAIDSIKCFFLIALSPDLSKLVTRLQVNVTVKNSCTILAHHHVVIVMAERELLNLRTSHIVRASFQTVDVTESVPCEVVRLVDRHFSLIVIYQENAFLLCYDKVVILPGEQGRLILSIVGFIVFWFRSFGQHAVVFDEIFSNSSYSSVNVEQSTILANELVACDFVAIDVQGGVLDLAIKF